MGKYIDLTGMKFGRLTVIRQEGRKNNRIAWLCRCECNNTTIKITEYLKKNYKCSCGCWASEIFAEACRKRSKTNTYDLSKEYGIGYLSSGDTFLFDKEDYEKIKDINWAKDGNGYATNKNIKLHRLVTDCPKGKEVDHINHNKLDNRKANLRVCNHSDNLKNQSKHSTNKSGYTGVGFHKASNKWRARITVDYKCYELGDYDTIEEAVKARKEAEKKYYGEFSNSYGRGINEDKNELYENF